MDYMKFTEELFSWEDLDTLWALDFDEDFYGFGAASITDQYYYKYLYWNLFVFIYTKNISLKIFSELLSISNVSKTCIIIMFIFIQALTYSFNKLPLSIILYTFFSTY